MRVSALSSALQTTAKVCRRCKSTSSAVTSEGPRLRFAPSPTGHLHLGGLRTALLNHLVARKGKGKWILRIEDTDRARFVPGAIDSLRSSLEWAGLEYDEGAGGNYGPYIQSERRDLYHYHVKRLLETDHAYECFCSNSDLDAIKTSLKAQGNRMSYDGRCRHLTDEERARKKKAGESYIVRFKDPGGVPVMPEDLVFGDVKPHTDTGHANHDDFVLMKSDGYPTYHLASVVDDHEMRITHVLRGEEWLPSLPKHVSLYRAFGWDFPHFAHLPLMVNSKGMKLSKRKDDVAIDSYREKGYEPEALLNFLGLLGWDHYAALEKTHGDMLPYHERNDKHSLYEIFSLPQLIQAFDLSHLSRRKAMVNIDKLDFINKMTLRRKAERLGEEGELVNLGKDGSDGGASERKALIERYQADLRALPELKASSAIEDEKFVETVFDLELPRIVRLNEMAETSTYFFLEPDFSSAEATSILSSCKEGSYVNNLEAVLSLLEDASSNGSITTDTIWDAVRDVVKEHRLKARSEIMLQMRHALTGQKKGPSIPEVVVVLGPERSFTRLRAGIEHVKQLHAS